MAIGKKLLVFSPRYPDATALVAAMSEQGWHPTVAETIEELRAKIEGGEFDGVLVEDSRILRRMIGEADPQGDLVKTSLAEIEKRHILRVVQATGGNKTHAARVLGIDTKTLYNKLKAYNASARRPGPQQAQSPVQQQQQQGNNEL